MDTNLITLATSLAEIAAKNTASFISIKMKEAQDNKDHKQSINMYSQIVNDLLNDKLELERIAKEYQDLYAKVTISDEDIEHLQNTLANSVDLMYKFSPQKDETKEAINILIELLNKDTLKTMQLIGFNYKEAIGEPLTIACASAISSKLKLNNRKK